jgi:hypothetical protein
MAGNWTGVSFDREVQRIDHSDEREKRDPERTNFHL